MFDRLQAIFGGGTPKTHEPSEFFPQENTNIGTEDAPLHGYEAAVERHEAAVRADASGDPETAIQLYERSVAENFVGSHPYEALASLQERHHNHAAALQATEAYINLTHSGKMPRGAQLSANRKLPEFENRAEKLRSLI